MKVAIIGSGSIARHHVSGYRACGAEVTACCDIDPEQARSFAEKNNIPKVYDSMEALFRQEQPDAVSVCSWNASHRDCTVFALDHGAHVLCEKPMALNAVQAREMLDAARRTGKLLQVGFVRRFGQDADAIRKFIENGTLGDIYYAKATYLRRNGCPGGWFGDKSLSGGGPLIDLGVHIIDLMRYLAGNPKPVSAYGVTYKNLGVNRAAGGEQAWTIKNGKVKRPYTVEDFAGAMIRFENGLTVSVETSFNLNCKANTGSFQLYGTKGGVDSASGAEIYTELAGQFVNIAPAKPVSFDFEKAFLAELKGFADAVEGGECRATAEDGLVMMQILDAIYRSAETGHEVLIG